ncbi:MAG: exodeoxyribonuclease V subunit alpha [Deferribacterales bacterium]
MTDILKTMLEKKQLRDIDAYFAHHISASFDAPEGELLFALIFSATEGGNTCLDMSAISSLTFYKYYEKEINEAVSDKTISSLIIKGALCEAPAMTAPFILRGEKLYMKSFYMDENSVAQFIRKRSTISCNVRDILPMLDKYFSENSMQKAAALNAAVNSFSIISGGPGTGKTSTVFKLLAVLAEISAEPLKIAVCAPTGKAASRLTESMQSQREAYQNEPFIDRIPEKAYTIHRLLGMAGDSRAPMYNKDNKLPYDILITDEASMVDISTMAKLTDAIKDECKLILLGDKDQLASVQPGAVLGDICGLAPVDIFTDERSDMLSKPAGKSLGKGGNIYSNISIMLDKSWRYHESPGIGNLASASGKGDWQTAMDVLQHDESGCVDFIEMTDLFENITSEHILNHYRNYASIECPITALDAFNTFRILTPHRQSTGGTEHINAIAQRTLFRAGYSDNTKRFYHGMPVMIVENDYSLQLFNGETGLIMGDKDMKACFALEKETVRRITPARLPAHVPAYAMTVHKSQGSEFEHVLFVLPESDSRILTRELFYTAVTRAKSRLTVISTKEAVRKCLTGRIERASGLSL